MYSTTPLQLPEHRDALVRLWSESLGNLGANEAAIQQRIDWLYKKNPNGPTRTWLGTSDDSQVIGCASVLSRDVLVGHRLCKVGVLADFAVQREHRFAGAALSIQKAVLLGARQERLPLVYGWPNDGSFPILKRLGYAVVGASNTWVKPLRSHAVLLQMIGRPKVVKAAEPLADQALRFNDWRLWLPYLATYRHEVLERADPRFDELTERSRIRGIVGRRTWAYLNWRYAEFTTARYKFFCLLERASGLIVGYIAYKFEKDVAFVTDMFCEDLTTHVAPLLLSFSQFARTQGAISVRLTYAGTSQFSNQLPSLGFLRRAAGRRIIVDVEALQPDTQHTVLDLENWCIFEGELDL
jgi:hypothetical protein